MQKTFGTIGMIVRVGNVYSNNYIEHESNSDRNKALSINKKLDEIKLYLKKNQ